jgi:hypothetical protein
MMNHNQNGCCEAAVKTFVRNRYFYGKMMDVLQFELEQDYVNGKRWLINRLVLGYGVVCGLDVEAGDDNASVVVQPGLAIDKWGREIIVPCASQPVPVPPVPATAPADDCDDTNCFHLMLCYHECQSDPVPALGGDCDQNALCTPGAVRERYELSFEPGKLPDVSTDCLVGDLLTNGHINYAALANYVSGSCTPCPDNPCIPLANVRVPGGGAPLVINIAIRPIQFSRECSVFFCETTLTAG